MKTLTAHPYADLFPMIEGEARASFTENIRANGVLAPVVLLDGRILDGRNRYRAAQELGIECPTVEFSGTDPLAFVIAANLERRHLSTAQRAAIGAEMARMKEGRPSKQTPSNDGVSVPQILTAQAAALMGVSTASIERAKARMRADPEAHERVKRGEDRPVKKLKAPEAANAPKSMSGPMSDENCSTRMAADPDLTPEQVEQQYRSEVATLASSDKRKFERLEEQLRSMYVADVQRGVQEEYKRQQADLIAEMVAERDQYMKKYLGLATMKSMMTVILTEDDYRFLLNVLHPDRAPADRREKFAKAFHIVRKLDRYIEAVKA